MLVYGTTVPAPTFTIYGDVAGSLTSGVSCVYSPSSPRNVGAYSIVCSGPPTTASATDGVTYNAPYLTFTPGVLTITQRPISVTADAKSKIYGDSDPVLTYHITSGNLVGADTFNGILSRAEVIATGAVLISSTWSSQALTLTRPPRGNAGI